MNPIVAKLFPVTTDALLVDKHLGKHFDNPFWELVLPDFRDGVLQMAKNLEAEAEAKKK